MCRIKSKATFVAIMSKFQNLLTCIQLDFLSINTSVASITSFLSHYREEGFLVT